LHRSVVLKIDVGGRHKK